MLNKQTCFNRKLARRESDRDQNSMLVITKSFGFVPHRRYIGYWIEKSRARMPGGGVCLSLMDWEGQMAVPACNQNFMCLVMRTQSCTVLRLISDKNVNYLGDNS